MEYPGRQHHVDFAGEHLSTCAAFGNVLTCVPPPLQYFWINELLYLLVLPLSRIALLLFYLRIFTLPPSQRAIYGLIGLNVAYAVGFEVAAVFQCTPIEGVWRFWDGQFPTKCMDMHMLAWLAAAFNIVLDVAVLALPILGLLGLRMSWRKKLQIMAMFSVGFLYVALRCRLVPLSMGADAA